MLASNRHSVHYALLLVLAVCSLQYALLAEIRERPAPDTSRLAVERESARTMSVLTDLIADSPIGLRGSYNPEEVVLIEAPKVEMDGNVASSLIFANDPYLQDLIAYYADYYHVDPVLVHLIIEQESGYDLFALSPAGAMGLMQLMPDTAWLLRVDDPWNPEENIEAGVRYFASQLDRFGSPELALAAYNAGPGSVEKWGGIPPYPETLNYIKSIMGRYKAENLKRSAEADSFTYDRPLD